MATFLKYLVFNLAFLLISYKVTGLSSIPEDIQDEVKFRVDNHFCPGIAIGVIDSSGTEFFCYGKLSYNSNKNVDKNTIFQIGSISKIYVSLILAQMVEDKLLSLDDPINKYLPDSIHIPTLNNEIITIKHLSTHTSCLQREIEPLDLFNYYNGIKERLYSYLSNIKDTLIVGKKFQYSNVGVDLLAQILINKSGLSYNELLEKYITKPFKLYDTYSFHEHRNSDNIALGHQDQDIYPSWDLSYSGCILSNANDLALFLKSQFIESNINNAINNTHALHFKISNDQFIGLGWLYDNKNKIYQHGGGTSGFRCLIGYSLKNKKGVVVLANSIFADCDIFGRLLDTTFHLTSYKPVHIDTPKLKKYAGYYAFEKKNFGISIFFNENKLYIEWGDKTNELFPLGNDKFFIKSEDVIFSFKEKENIFYGFEYIYPIGKRGFLTKKE